MPIIFSKDNTIKAKDQEWCASCGNINENIISILLNLWKVFLRNTYFIIIKTVPLMLFWWLIWVLITSLIPSSAINNLEINFISVLVVSIISFLLPVPMLFDVIFSWMVYNSILPSMFAFILLLNLWGFSIYPLLVLSQNIKAKKLFLFSVIFIISSTVTSYISYNIKNYVDSTYSLSSVTFELENRPQRNISMIEEINELTQTQLDKIIMGTTNLKTEKLWIPLYIETKVHKQEDNISISSFELEKGSITNSFEVIYGQDLWINDHWYRFSLMMNGIWISDYNDDNWKDIILPTGNGLKIYKNIWGDFQQDTSIILWEQLTTGEITQANFHDLDGDWYKDLLVATRNNWFHIIWNNQWTIHHWDSVIFNIPGNDVHTSSISIGDIFSTWNIDIFIWRWGGISKWENFRNLVLKNSWNRNLEQIWLQKENLWATLGSLIWDFDNDWVNELYEWNVVQGSGDLIYKLNSNTQSLYVYKDMSNLFPVVPYEHMWISMWDINNDLIPEFFISWSENKAEEQKLLTGQILSSCQYPKNSSLDKNEQEILLSCQVKELIVSSATRKECNLIQNILLKNLCTDLSKVIFSSHLDNTKEKRNFCNSLKHNFHLESFYSFCSEEATFKITDRKQPIYTQEVNNNVLLQEDDNWKKRNIVNSFKWLNSWWSWWAFFGDLDNNWYQDLYVWNWYIRSKRAAESNKIMMNYNWNLEPSETKLWWENFLDTFTSAYIDFDNDWDLDIINTSIFGDIIFFKNSILTQNSIVIQLKDSTTNNSEAIWAKVILGMPDGSEQIRFLYVWGHFLTLQDTQAHFWIWDNLAINYIKIIWPDWSSNLIEENLTANKKYLISK